jgi:hypothetical protein
MTGAKIGTIDIETSPIKGNVWRLFDQNVGLNQIDQEWTILSFSFVKLGGKKKDVIYMDTKGDPFNDYAVCEKLWQILDEYDIIIGQNNKKFDLKKIQARLIMHGFLPFSPVRVIDTLLMARQCAAFTSNKLEWLSDYLTEVKKSSHKAFPGFELWTECMRDNPKAWAEMEKYNTRDIISTQAVYLRLRPWVNDHPNLNVYHDDEKIRCPRCQSTDISLDGHVFTNIGKYPRYLCGFCGGFSNARRTINSISKRKSLLK